MTKAEWKDIAEELAEELLDVPDGTEITTAQLLKACGYDTERLDEGEIMTCHEYLFRAARARHITLDMSKHRFKLEGLAYNLDFAVRNRKAQIKCPRCGSRNTARILYGMPAFSDDLQEKLDSGRLRLGGCCITRAETGDGGMVTAEPARYCNDCGREFGFPPFLLSKDGRSAEAYRDIVTGIRLSIFDYRGGTTEYVLRKDAEGASVSVEQTIPGKRPVPDRRITPARWSRLVSRLYTELYVSEWKKNYKEPGDFITDDGERWELEITLTNRRRRRYSGTNAYPPYWPELKALLLPFLKS